MTTLLALEKAVQVDEKFVANFVGVDEAEIARLAEGGDGRTVNDLVQERHKKRMQALATALESEDDLGKVVRGHIHIENELEQIISFASPKPEHLKLKRQGFARKVQLALVLGLRADLAPALKAAADLRNEFAHELDTKLGKELAGNLIEKLPPTLKARSQAILTDVLASPAWKVQLEARLGRPLPELAKLAHPFDILKVEARILADARMDVITFFLCLFEALAHERHRFAA
jgi:hypothetical protein